MDNVTNERTLRAREELDRIVFYAVRIVNDSESKYASVKNIVLVNTFISVAVVHAAGNVRIVMRVLFGNDCPLLYDDKTSVWDNARRFIELLIKYDNDRL